MELYREILLNLFDNPELKHQLILDELKIIERALQRNQNRKYTINCNNDNLALFVIDNKLIRVPHTQPKSIMKPLLSII